MVAQVQLSPGQRFEGKKSAAVDSASVSYSKYQHLSVLSAYSL